MESSRFDELTKALATGTSRRQALKAIAATTIGSLLGLGGLGQAWASNSACAHWCAAVFGADTPAADQCTSEAAHHKGLCYKCGSATPPSSICCVRNASNYCTSYSDTLPCSCGANETCKNGTCVPTCTANGGTCSGNGDCCSGNCSNGVCCASGQVGLCHGTCATPCDPNNPQSCGSCDCNPDRDYCISGSSCFNCCSSDCDCPSGQFCSGGECFTVC